MKNSDLDLRNPHSSNRSASTKEANDALSRLVAELPAPRDRIQPPGSHPFDTLLVKSHGYYDPKAPYPTLYEPSIDPVDETLHLVKTDLQQENVPATVNPHQHVFDLKDIRLAELMEWQKGKRFDTTYLRGFEKVQKDLIAEEGFEPVEFITHDNLKIAGLWKDRGEDARCNIAISCGFLPGNPMGMATLYDSFPKWCNLLFIYARGHGKSEGNLKKSLWETKFAEGEPYDIIAALEWMHEQHPTLVNIPYGTCSGGFHSLNALLLLQEKERIAELNIRGAIIDSAWTNMEETGYKVAGNHMKGWKNGTFYYLLSAVYQALLKRGFTKVEAKRNLLNGRMDNFPPEVQLALVHGFDDPDVDIESIRELHEAVQNSSLWKVSGIGNPHAKMHLKRKHEYAMWLHEQLQKMLSEETKESNSDSDESGGSEEEDGKWEEMVEKK